MKGIKVNIPEVRLPGIPEINIQFLNGEITIPSKRGGYVIASGCGSGKTTAIRQIIESQYNQGIVYSAFTINECNEMYQFCKTILPENEIILLHSKYQDEGVDMNTFRNNPRELANKKVIICTHQKLLNEYPYILYSYNMNIVYRSWISDIHAAMISGMDDRGRKMYPRQLIIIDELPTCNSINFKVDRKLLRLIGVPDTEIRIHPETGKPFTSAKYPLRYTNGGDFSLTKEIAKENTDVFKDWTTESSALKNSLILSMIYDNYDRLNEMITDKKKSVNMTYTLSDQLIYDDIDTRILLFDGTGDLTFKNSEVFRVLTFNNKYTSKINIDKIGISYKRNYSDINEFKYNLPRIYNGINSCLDRVSNIIKDSTGTLIVTWKNFKIDNTNPQRLIVNEEEIDYTDYLRLKLRESGFIEDVNYSIIHYMSGLDKATNQFREYDTIVFLGEFHVPGYVVDKFNQDYRTNTTLLNYTTYQLVQAVCRTRIRNHMGEGINIYFTDDWDNTSIISVRNYIGCSSVSGRSEISLDRVKPKWKPIAKMFSDLDFEFKRAIESEVPYSIKFNLDDIYQLIPMNEKKVRSYYPMINYFRKLGIEINIEVNDTKFSSEYQPRLNY